MEWTDERRTAYSEGAQALKGYERRVFRGRGVKALGKGGQSEAERERGWCRKTIRKGWRELASGAPIIDNFSARGPKPAEAHLPHRLEDIRAMADEQSQTDPTFQTTRLYTRLSAAEMRRQLIEQKGYTDEARPSEETIRVKMKALGAVCTRVVQKKIPQTDAIFEELARVHAQARQDDTILRIALDANATIPRGWLSRGGQSRVIVKALDHDFKPEDTLTPYGIFLPESGDLYLYFTPGRVTRDFMVDCRVDVWQMGQERFPQVKTLLIHPDNGPENHSRRTQFMPRMTALVDTFPIDVHRADYPPSHSKYNPLERVWGVFEQRGNGRLLDTVETGLNFAHTLVWKGPHPWASD